MIGVGVGIPFNRTSFGGAPSFTNTKSLLFDGVDESGTTGVIQGTLLNSPDTTTWTVVTWFKYLGDDGTIYYDWHPSFGNFGIALGVDGGAIRVRLRSAAWHAGTTPLVSGNWYCVVHCYNKDVGITNHHEVYLNGGLEITSTEDTTTGGYTAHRFGANTNYNMDEHFIFNGDLRSEQASIYNSGVPHDLTNLSELPQHWWRFGDSVGDTNTTIIDVGAAATTYDITLTNFESGDIVTDTP